MKKESFLSATTSFVKEKQLSPRQEKNVEKYVKGSSLFFSLNLSGIKLELIFFLFAFTKLKMPLCCYVTTIKVYLTEHETEQYLNLWAVHLPI